VANLASFGRLAKKRHFSPDFSSRGRRVGKKRRFCKTGTNPHFLEKLSFCRCWECSHWIPVCTSNTYTFLTWTRSLNYAEYFIPDICRQLIVHQKVPTYYTHFSVSFMIHPCIWYLYDEIVLSVSVFPKCVPSIRRTDRAHYSVGKGGRGGGRDKGGGE